MVSGSYKRGHTSPGKWKQLVWFCYRHSWYSSTSGLFWSCPCFRRQDFLLQIRHHTPKSILWSTTIALITVLPPGVMIKTMSFVDKQTNAAGAHIQIHQSPTVGLPAQQGLRTAIAWRTLLLACKSWRRPSRRGECLLPNLFFQKLRQLRQDTRHPASGLPGRLPLTLGLKQNHFPTSETAQTVAKCHYFSRSVPFPCWSDDGTVFGLWINPTPGLRRRYSLPPPTASVDDFLLPFSTRLSRAWNADEGKSEDSPALLRDKETIVDL